MKKSFLCILLVFVLLLGGCVLTDFPVKTEGMVESAECCMDLLLLEDGIAMALNNLLHISNGNKKMAQLYIDSDNPLIDTSYIRTALDSCRPWLKEPCFSEEEILRLLDDADHLQELFVQSAEQFCADDAGYWESSRKAKKLAEQVLADIPSFVERWNASVDSLPENNSKAETARQFQTIFQYIYDAEKLSNDMYRFYRSVFRFWGGLPDTSVWQLSQEIDSLALTVDGLMHRFGNAELECRLCWDLLYSRSILPFSDLIEQTQDVIEKHSDSSFDTANALEELYRDFVDIYSVNLHVEMSTWDVYDLFREQLNPKPESSPSPEKNKHRL